MFAAKNELFTTPSGYQIQRSLRFRSSASAYLNRTFSTPTNSKTWTWNGWVKIGSSGFVNNQTLFGAGSYSYIYLNDGTNPTLRLNSSGTSAFDIATSQYFRDPAAWYMLTVAFDSTQATASNRVKMYVNGVQVTSFAYATYPALNDSTYINTAIAHSIGARVVTSSLYLDGYMAEVNFIDGQALTPSSFGAINAVTGVWSATKYAGTYGTNGFYLPFTDNSAATATTIGKDFSGNGNNWTPNNISVTAGATYDSMLDVPLGAGGGERGNYCVLNPIDNIAGATFSNGNLQIVTGNAGVFGGRSTISVASGKWYWEMTPTSNVSGAECAIGIDSAITPITSSSTGLGYSATSYSMRNSGQKVNNSTASSYGSSYTDNDVIGVALDLDTGTLAYYKNGTSQGTAFTGVSGTFTPAMSDLGGAQGVTLVANFGQRPFSYTPPTGFKALHTGNLGAPVIALPAQNMAATLYTGNSSTQTISNAVNSVSFQPDFVWIKRRSSAVDHKLGDSVRGTTKYLISNTTDAESTEANGVTSFNSNGFTLGSGLAFNYTGETYVGWQWKGGGTAVSNTAGSITSSVSANTTAGFSVVTWTGNATGGATIGHGLGAAPSFVISKRRDAADDWSCYHISLGGTKYIDLNSTAAAGTSIVVWNNTNPSSTVVTLGTSNRVNASGGTYVAYCFAPVAGYSAFGSYTGNGSADGPFIYTGFRPRFLMFKRTDSAGDWWMYDTSRSTSNTAVLVLYANTSAAEISDSNVDILSNGFKLRSATYQPNNSGGTYIYMAFAESPFKNSLAR